MGESLQSYAIIVNKSSANFLETHRDQDKKDEWIRDNLSIELEGRAPPRVYFFPMNEHAMDAADKILKIPDDFKEFLFNVHCNYMREVSSQGDDALLRSE